MTPWQRAKTWWDNHSTQDFWEAVGEHLSAGYVWNSPECFMLAKAARWNAEEQNFELGAPNCWFVTLAAASGPRDQETLGVCGSACAWRRMRTPMWPGAAAGALSRGYIQWNN